MTVSGIPIEEATVRVSGMPICKPESHSPAHSMDVSWPNKWRRNGGRQRWWGIASHQRELKRQSPCVCQRSAANKCFGKDHTMATPRMPLGHFLCKAVSSGDKPTLRLRRRSLKHTIAAVAFPLLDRTHSVSGDTARTLRQPDCAEL